MYQWHRQINLIVDEIDKGIISRSGEAITLRLLARKLGYSEFYTTRKFKEIAGMQLIVVMSEKRPESAVFLLQSCVSTS